MGGLHKILTRRFQYARDISPFENFAMIFNMVVNQLDKKTASRLECRIQSSKFRHRPFFVASFLLPFFVQFLCDAPYILR